MLDMAQSKLRSFVEQKYLQTVWRTANDKRVTTIEKIMSQKEHDQGRVILSRCRSQPHAWPLRDCYSGILKSSLESPPAVPSALQ